VIGGHSFCAMVCIFSIGGDKWTEEESFSEFLVLYFEKPCDKLPQLIFDILGYGHDVEC